MVVLMDPMEDPDDILRANRSREKSYLFDVAFDFTATQVRKGLGLEPRRSLFPALPHLGGAFRGPCPAPSPFLYHLLKDPLSGAFPNHESIHVSA
jgi:hypothetical protein